MSIKSENEQAARAGKHEQSIVPICSNSNDFMWDNNAPQLSPLSV